MKFVLLALTGVCLASCSTGMEIDKLDAYDAATMGYKQLDKCLMGGLYEYMDATVDAQLLTDMVATRCMAISQSQAGIIRYSKGDRWTKEQLAAPFLSHRTVQMRAFSIYAEVLRIAKAKKESMAKP